MNTRALLLVLFAAFPACGSNKTNEATLPAAPNASAVAAVEPSSGPAPGSESSGGPAAVKTLSPPPPAAPQPIMTAKDVGFATPESVYYLADDDVYLVSNINGVPSAKDGNGFISRLRPDGTIENLKWIDGSAKKTPLHAPKGMAVVKGVLYVSDIDTVRMFDVKTGASKGNIAIKGATFLNDVASDESGAVYVSDSGITISDKGITETGTDAVYKVVKGKVTPVAKSKELGKPNGVFIAAGATWVATFGSGEVYQLDTKGVRTNTAKPAGGLDGLFAVDGVVYVTSWEKSAVLRSGADGQWTQVLSGLTSPADATYDNKRDAIVIPLFQDNTVVAYKRPI